MYRARFHEWAWGEVGRRTVCGQTSTTVHCNTVGDLGNVATGDRCGNCERMRAAIGTSSRPVALEPAAPPSAVLEQVAADAARLSGELTAADRQILEHSTGWRSRWRLYRNHYCTSPGGDDWATIAGLIERGLMRVSRQPSQLSGGDTVFCVTAIGIAALKRAQSGAAKASEV